MRSVGARDFSLRACPQVMDLHTILRSTGAREPLDNYNASRTPTACIRCGDMPEPMGKPIGYNPARLQRAYLPIRGTEHCRKEITHHGKISCSGKKT